MMFNQFMVRDFDMHVRRFFVIPDGFGAVVTVVNFSENQLSAKERNYVENKLSEECRSSILN